MTPLVPAETGNGLAMRAGAILRALAESFDIHLYVIPLFPSPGARPEFTARHCVRVGRLNLSTHIDPLFQLISRLKDPSEREQAMRGFPKPELSRFITSKTGETLREWYGADTPDALHITRLYLAPLAAAFRNRGAASSPYTVLDMDEDDVLTRRRLAMLYDEYGMAAAAAKERGESDKYMSWAGQWLDKLDRVVLSSAVESDRLRKTWQGVNFEVVPNSIIKRPLHRHPHAAEATPRLLFVGNLSYLPNEDAVAFLLRDVFPRIKEILAGPVIMDIGGGGAGQRLGGFESSPDVRFHGHVKQLSRLYRQARIAVVPIRAGGGTRLKILEAFHYGLPVVATSIGAEGLEAVNQRHLLIADDATDFAAECARLLQNATLAKRISSRAASLVQSRYGLSSLKSHLSVVYTKIL